MSAIKMIKKEMATIVGAPHNNLPPRGGPHTPPTRGPPGYNGFLGAGPPPPEGWGGWEGGFQIGAAPVADMVGSG